MGISVAMPLVVMLEAIPVLKFDEDNVFIDGKIIGDITEDGFVILV